jgi:hypothetical protein
LSERIFGEWRLKFEISKKSSRWTKRTLEMMFAENDGDAAVYDCADRDRQHMIMGDAWI